MKHRNSHLLVGYWSRLRKGRAAPDQSDIDPRAIKRMLASVFILDAADAARPLYRLAGTQLYERYGSELKGSQFLHHWDGTSRSAVAQLLRQSLALGQPVCLTGMGSIQGGGAVEIEILLAPLSFGDHAPTRFIGLVQLAGDGIQLGGRPIIAQRLAGAEMIREDDNGSDNIQIPPMPPRESTRGDARAPHLRLVVDRPTLHRELPHPDRDMLRLLRALDIRPPKLTCLSGGMQSA